MGGAELALLRLIETIVSLGVIPIVAWPRRDENVQRLISCGVRVVGVRVPRWRHGLSLCLFPLFLARLRGALARERIDLVHVNNYRSVPFGHLASERAGVPCVATVREQVSPDKVRQYRLQRPDALIAVSNAVAQNLADGGALADRVTTVRSGVALGRMLGDTERRGLRERFNIAADVPVIGIVAHLLPHKGYDDLVEALALIARQVPTVRCLVIGEVPRRRYLRHLLDLAERHAVRERLVLVGPQADVPQFLGGMDLFVLPSHTEGLPLTVLEAMAAGKPVVATTVGGIPEAVRHGETGLLVPPREPGRLAEAVVTVLRDRALATSMGAAGRARAQALFSLETEARQTRAVYDDVVGVRRLSGSDGSGEAGS
jgi:glycosyltransferase involved in cell wall biosynthesis